MLSVIYLLDTEGSFMNHGIDLTSEKKILALISALFPQAKIYLFGSRARGTHSQWSDIDIALKGPEPINRHTIAELKRVIEASDVPYKVEIVDFASVSNDMQESISKEGILWQIS